MGTLTALAVAEAALPGDRSGSVFAQTWHALPQAGASEVDWPRLAAVREAVKKVLEDLRVGGQIGSGLNAEVALHADGELAGALATVGEELRFWFITSAVTLQPAAARPPEAVESTLPGGETLWIAARASAHAKCERCWHQRPEVGQRAAHPTLCDRCIVNVDGAGETRRYI